MSRGLHDTKQSVSTATTANKYEFVLYGYFADWFDNNDNVTIQPKVI